MVNENTPLSATLENRIILEDDLFKEVVKRSGEGETAVKNLHKEFIKELKRISLEDADTLIIQVPYVGNLVANYQLLKAQQKKFKKKHRVNRLETINKRKEKLQSMLYRTKRHRNVRNFRNTFPINHSNRLSEKRQKDIYTRYYDIVAITENFTNERYEDFKES